MGNIRNIENLQNRLDICRNRIRVLDQHLGTVRIPALDGISPANLNFLPWDYKLHLVNEYRNANDASFFSALKIAFQHLEYKFQLSLPDGEHACSEAAASLGTLSRVPVLGTLFSAGALSYRNRGIDKELSRLDEISTWLNELERRHLGLFRIFRG